MWISRKRGSPWPISMKWHSPCAIWWDMLPEPNLAVVDPSLEFNYTTLWMGPVNTKSVLSRSMAVTSTTELCAWTVSTVAGFVWNGWLWVAAVRLYGTLTTLMRRWSTAAWVMDLSWRNAAIHVFHNQWMAAQPTGQQWACCKTLVPSEFSMLVERGRLQMQTYE